jgi:hypothetical protein
VLTQLDDDGREFVVAYANQSNKKMEAKYSSYEGVCLVVVELFHHSNIIFMIAHFTLIIDHQPLKFLMESNWLIGKLARWALILQEYDFDIIHRPCKVNQDANGLNQNPSSNKEDTTGALWHDDVDLEIIPGWHASAYLCTLLGCFGDVLQTSVNDGDPHDVDMESKGNGALDIYDDAPIITYLQVSEIPIGLTPKERDHVVHKAKQFKWEGNSFLWMWVDGQVKVMFHPEQLGSLVKHAHEKLGHFGVQQTYSLL